VNEDFRSTWTTRDELAHIDGLGMHRRIDSKGHPRKYVTSSDTASTIALLESYLRSVELRSRWTGLDREAIVQHARKRIDLLRKLQTKEQDAHGESR
jgi:hypothetical protein